MLDHLEKLMMLFREQLDVVLGYLCRQCKTRKTSCVLSLSDATKCFPSHNCSSGDNCCFSLRSLSINMVQQQGLSSYSVSASAFTSNLLEKVELQLLR
jgi:hypothetical protein